MYRYPSRQTRCDSKDLASIASRRYKLQTTSCDPVFHDVPVGACHSGKFQNKHGRHSTAQKESVYRCAWRFFVCWISVKSVRKEVVGKSRGYLDAKNRSVNWKHTAVCVTTYQLPERNSTASLTESNLSSRRQQRYTVACNKRLVDDDAECFATSDAKTRHSAA